MTVPQEKHAKLAQAIIDILLDDYNISAPCYSYAGKVYVRIAGKLTFRVMRVLLLAECIKLHYLSNTKVLIIHICVLSPL